LGKAALSELRRDLGQLVIMGFTGTEMTSQFRVVLRAVQPAGVVLFARNISNAMQTYELLNACESVLQDGPPLFRCVDLEGGTVDRLREVIAPAPAAAVVAATGEPKLFRKFGRMIGEEVRAIGFNTNFAPVFDLGFDASRKVLTTRTVSADPLQTVAFARGFLSGLHDAKVLGCGKHFPGLGEANLDSHFAMPRVDKSFDKMWREDLYPYRELRKEIAFVMVAHAAYPQISGKKEPASLSKKWLTDILRKKIGYKGLILTDDLEMGGVTVPASTSAAQAGDTAERVAAKMPKAGERGSIEYAAIETLRAGADMFLVCHTEEAVWRAYEGVLREAERDKRFRNCVGECARRVRRVKENSRELRKRFTAPNERTVERLKRDVDKFRDEVRRAAQPTERLSP
jgi:beta-N-acetylhexosaminidase